MTDETRYLRLALFSDSESKEQSAAGRLKESLEAQGHTVFWFDPVLHPYVYTRKGVVRGYMVRKFFCVQRLDLILLADGLSFDYPVPAYEAASAPVGLLCEDAAQAELAIGALLPEDEQPQPHFALCMNEEAASVLESDGRVGKTYCLDGFDAEALDGVKKSLCADFSIEGCRQPRSIACVFGYLGTTNYANEHILATIDHRLRSRAEGSSVIAIGVNPEFTLEYRGVYAVAMQEKFLLDQVLAYASVVMVIAGLINENGIRYSMGKAEMLCNAMGCDICSIAALAVLCDLNDTKLLLYGGGIGPLDLADARKYVALMGKLGGVFVSRDEASAQLLLESGVSVDSIVPGADPALLGSFGETQFVNNWLAEREIDLSAEKLFAVSLRSGAGFPDDFPQRAAKALKLLLSNHEDLRVILCAVDDADANLLDKVKAAIGEVDRVNIFHAGAREDALGDLLSRAYAGFSMQYYATLGLMRAGVPCMGIACQAKEGALFGEVGCDELLLPGDVSEEQIVETIEKLLADRDAWKKLVDEGMSQLVGRIAAAEDIVVDALCGELADCARQAVGERYCYPYKKSANERAHDREVANLNAKLKQANEGCDKMYRLMASREYRLGSKIVALPRKVGLVKDDDATEE